MPAQYTPEAVLVRDKYGNRFIITREPVYPTTYDPRPVYDPREVDYLPSPVRPPPVGGLARAVGVWGLTLIIALALALAGYSWVMHGSSGHSGPTGRSITSDPTGGTGASHALTHPPPPTPPVSGHGGGNGGGGNGGAAGSNSAAPGSTSTTTNTTNNYYLPGTQQPQPQYPNYQQQYPYPYPPPPPTYWGGAGRYFFHRHGR
jgi:hypothetical protein